MVALYTSAEKALVHILACDAKAIKIATETCGLKKNGLENIKLPNDLYNEACLESFAKLATTTALVFICFVLVQTWFSLRHILQN